MRQVWTKEEEAAFIAALNSGLSIEKAAAQLGRTKGSGLNKHRLLKEAGFEQPSRVRPLPADFTEMTKTLGYKQLKRHYRTSDERIQAWYKEAKLKRPPRTPKKLAPPDFKDIAPTSSQRELSRHYGVCVKRIQHWLRETGSTYRRVTAEEVARARWGPKKPEPPKKKPLVWNATVVGAPIPGPDSSPDGQAAHHLRKWGPVYRCTKTGRADQKGDFWRVGNVVLTPDEVIERAEAKGHRGWALAA